MAKRKLTTDIVITDLQKVHPEYDYSGVVFNRSRDALKIICDKGHEFLCSHDLAKQSPSRFKCAICYENALFNEMHANKLFPDNFSYNVTSLKKKTQYIDITCNICGEKFNTRADWHFGSIKFGGCRVCAVNSTRLDFVAEATKKHNGRFTYIGEYARKHGTITFICPVHGLQKMTGSRHLGSNTGCSECSLENTAVTLSDTTEEFVSKASVKFPNLDFSKVNYVNSMTPVIVICPEHGEFENKPEFILRGTKYAGCIPCSIEGRKQPKIKGLTHTLYFLKFKNEVSEFVKIGITGNLDQRFTGCIKRDYVISELFIATVDTKIVTDMETYILTKFSNYSFIPDETFGGKTECFTTTAQALILDELGMLFDIIL